jgi:hypothetical protein
MFFYFFIAIHLFAYALSLKNVSSSQQPTNIWRTTYRTFFLAYLSSEGIPRRPVQIVLSSSHVPHKVPAHYFSLTNSLVPDPLSSHGICGGVGRYILGKFVKLGLMMFFCWLRHIPQTRLISVCMASALHQIHQDTQMTKILHKMSYIKTHTKYTFWCCLDTAE